MRGFGPHVQIRRHQHGSVERLPLLIPGAGKNRFIQVIIVAAGHDRRIVRVNADPLDLIVHRNIGCDPMTELFVERIIEIQRILIITVQGLVQQLICNQGMTDRNSAINHAVDILSRPLQRDLQILLFPLLDQPGHPVHKQIIDYDNRQQNADYINQHEFVIQRDIVHYTAKSELSNHGFHHHLPLNILSA